MTLTIEQKREKLRRLDKLIGQLRTLQAQKRDGQDVGDIPTTPEKDFRGWSWNLLRAVPGYAASIPAAAMQGTPVGQIVGSMAKATEPISQKLAELPIFSPLRKAEEKIFAPGMLQKPQVAPETAGAIAKRPIETMRQAPTVGEGLVRVTEEMPGIGVVPRSIRHPESWYENPLPNIMDVAMLFGGYEAGMRAKAPKTLEEPYMKAPIAARESIQKVVDALKEAKPKRAKQEEIYTAERGEKLAKGIAVEERAGGGEAGFKAKKAAMAGELTKVEFEAIRDKISEGDIHNIFEIIRETSELSEWERLPAGEGLGKIFGERGGRVPTENEIMLLNRALGSEFTRAVLRKRSLWKKAKEAGWQLANIPRSIMASFDLSAPLRQGIFMIYKPKQFFSAFENMFKSFGSEKASVAAQQRITQMPDYKLMKQSELPLTELGRSLRMREEAFMSNWAEKIPGVGRMVRASGRAHMAFLNQLRADTFVDLIMRAEKLGLKPRQNPQLSRAIAKFIGDATGRGSLGSLERSAVALNTFFFSPRLAASRIHLLNPGYYLNPAKPKFVRKEAIKALVAYTGTVTTVLSLAKMAGAEVGLDPRDANFGKIMIGKTRVDIMAGFQQYVRAAAQFFGNQYVSSITGKKRTLGEGYKPMSQWDILWRQIESKQAPIISFITDLLKRQDWKGEDISIPKEVGRRLVPMVLMDMIEIAQEDPKLLPLGVPGLFGVGLQHYELYSKKEREFNSLLSDAEGVAMEYKELKPSEMAGFAMKNRQLLGSVSLLRSLSRRMSELRKRIAETEKSTMDAETKRARIAELEAQIEGLAESGLKLKGRQATP